MRFASTILASSLLLGTMTALLPAAVFAQGQDNPSSAAVPPADAPGSLAPNQAHFICTAAINSTGTIAGGNFVDPARTFRLGTGR